MVAFFRCITAVVAYRFYFSDKNARLLGSAQESECADDDAAIAKAAVLGRSPMPDAAHVEIWQFGRLVGRIPVMKG